MSSMSPYEPLTDLCLDHGGSLCPECPHCLEDIHHSLILHPLQHDAQGDEHTRPPDTGAEKRVFF